MGGASLFPGQKNINAKIHPKVHVRNLQIVHLVNVDHPSRQLAFP